MTAPSKDSFLHFMKTKVILPLAAVGVLSAALAFRYAAPGPENEVPATRHAQVLQGVLKTIETGHFAPRLIDDSFSARVYEKVLEQLDYEKKFFTAADIAELRKNQYRIDDQIKVYSTAFYDQTDVLFTKSIARAERLYKDILATPFTFNNDEQIQLAGDKLSYAADEAALRERWRLFLKYQTLLKYVSLEDAQAKDSTGAKKKTETELEADARASVLKNQDAWFKRLRKVDSNQRFTLFVNAITSTEDPHTDYFPPKDKQRFDEAMSGSFSGIGAALKDEEGKIKVASIITGSPAWKQGILKAGDEIQKVAQGRDEPEDITGFEMDDVIQKIRGKKGTEVRLTVRKVDGSITVVPITRGDVLMEETFARSAIFGEGTQAIGYIYLPEFYADFNHMNGRRSGEDVAKEVEKLKAAGVSGIILDVRNNGGGSLSDVVDIAGLFIDQGPVVQVKSSDAAPMTLRDGSRGALWNGPLAVMVNGGSASASEILAAAMQDYGRAIIIGSTTFGKGTVQKVVSVDDNLDLGTRMRLAASSDAAMSAPIGSVKLTMQKFYRVNGGSTQLRGVTPDISLPDPYKYIELGERRDKTALPWDVIPAAGYKPVPNAVAIAALKAKSASRVSSNTAFALIDENAKRLKKLEDDNLYSLNETAFRAQQTESSALSKKLDALEERGTTLPIANPKEDLPNINRDSSTVAKNADWIKLLKKDIYLAEAIAVMGDLVKQTGNWSMTDDARR